MSDTPHVLLAHCLKTLKLPTFLREVTFQRGAFGDDEPPGDSITLNPPRSVLSTIHIDPVEGCQSRARGSG